MLDKFRTELMQILSAVTISSEYTFSIAGKHFNTSAGGAQPQPAANDENNQHPLVQLLQQFPLVVPELR